MPCPRPHSQYLTKVLLQTRPSASWRVWWRPLLHQPSPPKSVLQIFLYLLTVGSYFENSSRAGRNFLLLLLFQASTGNLSAQNPFTFLMLELLMKLKWASGKMGKRQASATFILQIYILGPESTAVNNTETYFLVKKTLYRWINKYRIQYRWWWILWRLSRIKNWRVEFYVEGLGGRE